MLLSSAVRLFSGNFLNTGGIDINTGLIQAVERLQFNGRVTNSAGDSQTETNGPYRLHQGVSRTNVGVPNIERNRGNLLRRALRTDVPTLLSLKNAAQLYFQADGRLDASSQRQFKRLAPMLGGLMRGYTGDVLNGLVPTLTGVVNTEVYASGIYEKMFIAAFCAQQIESLGGFNALDPAGARYFQNFPGAGYPLIAILNPGLTAPRAGGPMWGPNAANVIGNDIAATQWLYRGGAIPNAPPALPADLVNHAGAISTQDVLVLNDLGLRLTDLDLQIIAAILAGATCPWGASGPGGLFSLHGTRYNRATPRALLILGRTCAAYPAPLAGMPTSAQIFLAIQHLAAILPDVECIGNGFVDAITTVYGKVSSAAAGAAAPADLGGPMPGGPAAAGFAVGCTLDCARGAFQATATYLDTFNQSFGGCFIRALPSEVERLLALLTSITFEQQLSKFSELSDKVMTICTAFDANYLPAGTQQDVPGLLYAQLAQAYGRILVGINEAERLFSIQHAHLTGLLSGFRDTLLPAQSMIEKAGWKVCPELLSGYHLPTAQDLNKEAKLIGWSAVTPQIIDRSFSAIRDVENVDIIAEDEDPSLAAREGVKAFATTVAAALRLANLNVPLPAGAVCAIVRAQVSFHDSLLVGQLGPITVPFDIEGFLQVEILPMLARDSSFSEFRIPAAFAGRNGVVMNFRNAKAGEGAASLAAIVATDGDIEPVVEPSTMVAFNMAASLARAKEKKKQKGSSGDKNDKNGCKKSDNDGGDAEGQEPPALPAEENPRPEGEGEQQD
ncbi:unnamed protein product [Symbiodinium microadriaticum]|nr:unnamed protein product [Symbiodinium microadriaticum]